MLQEMRSHVVASTQTFNTLSTTPPQTQPKKHDYTDVRKSDAVTTSHRQSLAGFKLMCNLYLNLSNASSVNDAKTADE